MLHSCNYSTNTFVLNATEIEERERERERQKETNKTDGVFGVKHTKLTGMSLVVGGWFEIGTLMLPVFLLLLFAHWEWRSFLQHVGCYWMVANAIILHFTYLRHRICNLFLFKQEVEWHYYPYLEPFATIILNYASSCKCLHSLKCFACLLLWWNTQERIQ